MLILQAILLGLIQGITEFIPISSSAHLIIIPWLFGWNSPILESLTFDVALHLGTLVALIVFFWQDWKNIIKAGFASIIERKINNQPERRLAWFIIIATIPAAIAGLSFEHTIENYFHSSPIQPNAMLTMALIIAMMGILLLLADQFSKRTKNLNQISFLDSILIGISQACALFPGVSSSGVTLTSGLALGYSREAAARFSFLLSTPIIAGSGLKSLHHVYKGLKAGIITSSELMLFPIGLLSAAISGYFCIRFLINYLQKHSVNIFVYYRFALAALVIAVALMRK